MCSRKNNWSALLAFQSENVQLIPLYAIKFYCAKLIEYVRISPVYIFSRLRFKTYYEEVSFQRIKNNLFHLTVNLSLSVFIFSIGID